MRFTIDSIPEFALIFLPITAVYKEWGVFFTLFATILALLLRQIIIVVTLKQ